MPSTADTENDSSSPESVAFPINPTCQKPHDYQLQFFNRACEKNVIVCLNTNAGKTLIAALLIGHVLHQEQLNAEKQAKLITNTTVLPPITTASHRVAIFLVHRVPLVDQQANVIRSVLPTDYEVGAYYGAMGVDSWSGSKWNRSLSTNHAAVMTAQIFLNLLRHGIIDMRDVSLVVVDEAHHATKKHPYRIIFLEFYHALPKGARRPKIFGMSATPILQKAASKEQWVCMDALAALEVTLDATVITVTGEAEELVETVAPKPDEYVITYDGTFVKETEAMKLTPEEILVENEAISNFLTFSSPPSSIDVLVGACVDEDGDISMDGVLRPSELNLIDRIRCKLGYKAAADFTIQLCRISGIAPTASLDFVLRGCEDEISNGGLPDNVLKLLDLLYAEYVRCEQESIATASSPGEDMNVVKGRKEDFRTPRDHDADAFRCIVFIQERTSALCLTWLINSVFSQLNRKQLTARCVFGQQSSPHVRMSLSSMKSRIDDFRSGLYGIMVATNVVEEGLDVPACRLVISFDKVSSSKAYVQGRGRARKRGAKYITFIEDGESETYKAMKDARHGANVIRHTIKSRLVTEEERCQARAKFLNEVCEEERALTSRSTSARVSATYAVALLHRYCATKGQRIDEPGEWRPEYSLFKSENEDCPSFTAKVTLPSEFPVQSGSCEEPQKCPALARKYAALDAYTKLYELGEVDEFLLPLAGSRAKTVLSTSKVTADIGVKSSDNKAEQKRRREQTSKSSKKNNKVRRCSIIHPRVIRNLASTVSHGNVMDVSDNENMKGPTLTAYDGSQDSVSLPDSLSNLLSSSQCYPQQLYMYIINIDANTDAHEWYRACAHERFCLLVPNTIPFEDLEALECPYGKKLFTLNYIRTVPWTNEMQEKAYRFVRLVQLCLRGRTPGSPQALEIELDEYSKSVDPGFFLLPLALPALGEHMEVDWLSIERLLSYGWRFGPTERYESGNLEHSLVCSYHENCIRVYMSGKISRTLQADSYHEQRLNSSYHSFAHYYLKKHGVCLQDEKQFMLEGFSIRETMCNLSTSCFMLPPETCRLIPLSPMACYIACLLPMWQTFLALRACWRRNRLSGNSIDFLCFARALQPNINNVVKEGSDLSYERLEFLGDAVLKIIYSMVMFVKHPHVSEGILSDDRDEKVSNERLANIALDMQLHHCLAFSGVSQTVRSWPWFWATHQRENIDISEKVLADCVEALIGAQYLNGDFEMATKFVDKHNIIDDACDVLKVSDSSNDDVRVVVSPPPNVSTENRVDSIFIRRVEEAIQYEFRDKRHLVTALTHGSYANGRMGTYQRYEYLGDAIIGFILLSYFFTKYPKLNPGELTTLRGPALSNDLFARVIVAWNLQDSFWHNCSPLQEQIEKFANLYENEEDGDEDISKSMTVPKVLGDLLESIIGAVVIDKGMRLNGVEDIVLRLMDEELERFCNPAKFHHNPVSLLVRVVQGQMNCLPRYVFEDREGGTVKICRILIEGEEYGRGQGPTHRVAKRRASAEALSHFENQESSHDAEEASGASS